MDEDIKANITSPHAWLRLLLMIAFAIVANVLIWLVWLIAAVQFICSLITGRVNSNLDDFSEGLVIYLTRIFEYLVYRSDIRPFPFSSWDDMVAGTGVREPQPAEASPEKAAKPAKKPKSEKPAQTKEEEVE